MSWRGNDRGGRRGYHHGNLREALVEAALRLIAEKGPGGLTFADAARAAGVSAAAPYRHYRDREALLCDVARRGYERFADTLERAWQDGTPTAAAAMERIGRAYLHFARTEPAYYAAMFESGLVVDADPALHAAAERAFAVLRTAAERLATSLPGPRRPPALMLALHIWAMTHGIASLFGRPDGTRRPIPMSPEELLEAGVLVYLQGLGAEPSGPKSGA